MKTRRTLVLVLIVLVLCTTGAFAAKGSGLAIGGEGALYINGTGGMPMGAMLSLHLPGFPLMLGIGVDNSFDIGLTADYWVAHGNLGGIFSWYFGAGAYLSLYTGDSIDIALGGRFPLALQMWPFGANLEIFLEAAPAVGLYLIPTVFDFHVQSALGFRWWF
jgi:hypothetical protein